jgi:hypothetical protein
VTTTAAAVTRRVSQVARSTSLAKPGPTPAFGRARVFAADRAGVAAMSVSSRGGPIARRGCRGCFGAGAALHHARPSPRCSSSVVWSRALRLDQGIVTRSGESVTLATTRCFVGRRLLCRTGASRRATAARPVGSGGVVDLRSEGERSPRQVQEFFVLLMVCLREPSERTDILDQPEHLL